MTMFQTSTPWWGMGGFLMSGQMAIEVESVSSETKVDDGAKTTQQAMLQPWAYAGGNDCGFGGGVAGCGSLAGKAGAPRTLGSNYQSYRRMRADPIVAIAREIADSLICISEWTYEPRDKNVDPKWVELIKDTWEGTGGANRSHQGLSLRAFILSESCRAKDFGNHTLEIVWGDNEKGQTTVVELPPLLPDNTRPLVVKGTRTFAGVRNWGVGGAEVYLDPQYCARMVYDAEGGDFFGRSRYENVREWVQLKADTRNKIRTDLNVAIGNIMAIGYPGDEPGTRTGTNAQSAATIANLLTIGQSVIYKDFSTKEKIALAQQHVDPDKLRAWNIDRIDTGNNNLAGFKVAFDIQDEQILFGLLVLPRSVKEAEHGSKADAEEHTDTMAMMAWRWICYIVGMAGNISNDILEQNFGKSSRGSVVIKAKPISDATLANIQAVMVAFFTGNPDAAMKSLDIKAMGDKLGYKFLETFDQQKVAIAVASKGAGDVLSEAEKLRNIGHDEKGVKRIQQEKATEVPTDPDALGGAPVAKGAAG